jgi:hypothetical protein
MDEYKIKVKENETVYRRQVCGQFARAILAYARASRLSGITTCAPRNTLINFPSKLDIAGGGWYSFILNGCGNQYVGFGQR